MFTRLLIRLRWPTAVIAFLVSAVKLASAWRGAGLDFPLLPSGPFVSIRVWPGQLALGWRSHTDGRTFYFRVFRPVMNVGSAFPTELELPWTWWDCWEIRQLSPGVYRAIVPIWTAVLPPVLLAGIGFRLQRRQCTPDSCKRCRYPLNGASQCPECGRIAPSN